MWLSHPYYIIRKACAFAISGGAFLDYVAADERNGGTIRGIDEWREGARGGRTGARLAAFQSAMTVEEHCYGAVGFTVYPRVNATVGATIDLYAPRCDRVRPRPVIATGRLARVG
ncbi:unnamed protein product, partial [Iphiclides podalirius]